MTTSTVTPVASTTIDFARHLSREQCLLILAEASESVLRAAAAAAVANPAAVAVNVPTAAAPAAGGKPAAAKPGPAKAKAAAAAPAAVATPSGTSIEDAITALAPSGFAAGEVAELTGLDARASSIKTAIAAAIKAKSLFTFGERRFTRYGATVAIAKTRSNADRGAK